MNIKIIGLGGVGTILADALSRYLNYSDISYVKMTFVDGDSYEKKNLTRQLFEKYGNKAKSKSDELSEKFSEKIEYDYFPIYLNISNVSSILQDNDIIFVAVDNFKTRKIISDYCLNLNNSTIILGGNEYTDGNVQIFCRKEGKNLTPTIDKYHREIKNPSDVSPEEMSCEELAQSEPQLFFMNMMIACYMCAGFYNVLIKNKIHPETYIDMIEMKSVSRERQI